MKIALKSVCSLAATPIIFGSIVGEGNAAVVIDIEETGGGIRFSVAGSIPTTAVTRQQFWNSPPSFMTWSNPDLNQVDTIVVLEDSSYRYSILGATDTGILNTSFVTVRSSNAVLTGTGYSIGTSYFGGAVSLILSESLNGAPIDYALFFPERNFASLGLSDGQTRTVTFDDGVGGMESIQWNVGSAVPEPSSALFVGLGGLGLLACRRRNRLVEQGGTDQPATAPESKG